MFLWVMNILILEDTQAFEIVRTEPDLGWVISPITYNEKTEDDGKLYRNFMQSCYLIFLLVVVSHV